MTAAQAAENHGDLWGLTWYLRWGIYASVPTWTHSQNSLAATEALSLKVSPNTTSLKWSQRQWNRASCFNFIGKSMETETPTWLEFPNGRKAIVEQILALEEINKSKRARLWESRSGIQVVKLTTWTRLFEVDKQLAHGLMKRTWSMLDEIESKTVQKDWEGDHRGKRNKTLSEIKPVENTTKNMQSFLEVSSLQDELLVSHKLQDYTYE